MRGSDQENDGFLCPAGVCLNEHLPHDGNVVFHHASKVGLQGRDCGQALPGRWNRMADQRSAQATIGALSETVVGRSDRLC